MPSITASAKEAKKKGKANAPKIAQSKNPSKSIISDKSTEYVQDSDMEVDREAVEESSSEDDAVSGTVTSAVPKINGRATASSSSSSSESESEDEESDDSDVSESVEEPETMPKSPFANQPPK